MTKSDFQRLLCSFVAAVGDAHTEVYAHHNVNPVAPGGIPLKLGITGKSLFVTGVPGDQFKKLQGAMLVSVEDVSLDELSNRLRDMKPIDNHYGLLWHFATNYLWYGPYLQDLLPEWKDIERLRVSFRLASGEITEVVFDLPINVASLTHLPSRLDVPSPDESGFVYDFLDRKKRLAYLRIDHMKHYRESYEARNSLGLQTTLQDELDKIPSATEFFKTLAAAMKNADTEALIVDLRRNEGGDALMADIMMYFLYGKDATLQTRWNNVNKLSRVYLDARKNLSLEDLSRGLAFPLIEGDYDFSEDFADSVLADASALEEGLAYASTFFAEWKSGLHEGEYCPKNVIVLTSPWTFSAGFGIAVRLYRMCAILVGTPSGQAPNSGGNAVRWTLENSGITGRVSQSYVLNFPEGSELSRVLPVQYPLTYELLASYGYDPNAEVLYAMDLLPKLEKQKE